MVGMEDGPYRARRETDENDDGLFSEPPALFLDEEFAVDGDDDFQGSGSDYESWGLESDVETIGVSPDDLLPNIGLFDFDDDDLIAGDVSYAPPSDPASRNGASPALGPTWTDDRPAVPPVVLHPTPGGDGYYDDSQWAGSVAPGYPTSRHEQEPDDDVEDEGAYRKSRRFNRVLMVLTVLVVAGVIGGAYMYLNREQTTPTATADTADSTDPAQADTPAEPGAEVSGDPTTTNAAVLTGPNPVGILTTAGTVRIATATETDTAAAEYGTASGLGEAKFVGLTEDQAFVVDTAGDAWRINFRADATPLKLVELGPPGATTTYHFLGTGDGTIYFTDSNGTLWSVDATDTPSSVYSPESPDAAIAQLASNPTTLFIRTIGGDVFRHDHGSTQTQLAYGPTNENPKTVSLAPSSVGVVLTAGGGAVRLVDPSKDPPMDIVYKPKGDKAASALSSGPGAVVLTQSGNVVYSVLGSEDVPAYTADPAGGKPTATQIMALGNGTIGTVDGDGNLWALDLTAENPTKIWDAASLGALGNARPDQDVFIVSDTQGNVWSVPTTAGASAQQLSASGDAKAIATGFFTLDDTTN